MNPLVADVNGRSLLMTRFFRSLNPPRDLMENSDSSAESVAWFVSLIPHTPRNALFPGLKVAKFYLSIWRIFMKSNFLGYLAHL